MLGLAPGKPGGRWTSRLAGSGFAPGTIFDAPGNGAGRRGATAWPAGVSGATELGTMIEDAAADAAGAGLDEELGRTLAAFGSSRSGGACSSAALEPKSRSNGQRESQVRDGGGPGAGTTAVLRWMSELAR
mmetsp:Transcript_110365/g.344066  ORF Transcript_110365/g.344066 Transcript_110365/m.344066 type:complete len:131 (+) Transcript_110365:396-788(+)